MEEMKNKFLHTYFLSEIIKDRGQLSITGADMMILLEWIYRNRIWCSGLKSADSEQIPVASFSGYSDERVGSI